MEEIPNNHLGCIKPCRYWDKLPINWCRISSINNTNIPFWEDPFIGLCIISLPTKSKQQDFFFSAFSFQKLCLLLERCASWEMQFIVNKRRGPTFLSRALRTWKSSTRTRKWWRSNLTHLGLWPKKKRDIKIHKVKHGWHIFGWYNIYNYQKKRCRFWRFIPFGTCHPTRYFLLPSHRGTQAGR